MKMCEKLCEREATVFITRVVEGKSRHVRLCETCAREWALADACLAGVPIPLGAAKMPLDELLNELLTAAPKADWFKGEPC